MFSFYQRIQECKSLDSHIKAKDNIILVDDGVATGATVIATARWNRRNYNSKRLIICVPVVPKQTRDLLKKESDYVETIAVPSDSSFQSVGQYYQNFQPVEDEQVIETMRKIME